MEKHGVLYLNLILLYNKKHLKFKYLHQLNQILIILIIKFSNFFIYLEKKLNHIGHKLKSFNKLYNVKKNIYNQIFNQIYNQKVYKSVN